MQILKTFFSKTTQQIFLDIAHNSNLIYGIKVCSNSGATYIISKIIVKDNLNLQQI